MAATSKRRRPKGNKEGRERAPSAGEPSERETENVKPYILVRSTLTQLKRRERERDGEKETKKLKLFRTCGFSPLFSFLFLFSPSKIKQALLCFLLLLFLLQDVVMQVATSPRGGMSIKKGQGSEKMLTFFCFVFPFFLFLFCCSKKQMKIIKSKSPLPLFILLQDVAAHVSLHWHLLEET